MAQKLPAHRRRAYQQAIAQHEACTNGLYMYSGGYVFARNIREDRKQEVVRANVVISFGEGKGIKKHENCQYPLSMFREDL